MQEQQQGLLSHQRKKKGQVVPKKLNNNNNNNIQKKFESHFSYRNFVFLIIFIEIGSPKRLSAIMNEDHHPLGAHFLVDDIIPLFFLGLAVVVGLVSCLLLRASSVFAVLDFSLSRARTHNLRFSERFPCCSRWRSSPGLRCRRRYKVVEFQKSSCRRNSSRSSSKGACGWCRCCPCPRCVVAAARRKSARSQDGEIRAGA